MFVRPSHLWQHDSQREEDVEATKLVQDDEIDEDADKADDAAEDAFRAVEEGGQNAEEKTEGVEQQKEEEGVPSSPSSSTEELPAD